MGLELAQSSLGPFLETGLTLAFFKLSGKLPVVKNKLYMKHKCSAICYLVNFNYLYENTVYSYCFNARTIYFKKCGWRGKSSPKQLQISFFNRFSGDNLFSSLASLVFSYSCFFVLLFVWNWKCIFWYTFDHAGKWVIKKVSPGQFPQTRLVFYGLIKTWYYFRNSIFSARRYKEWFFTGFS